MENIVLVIHLLLAILLIGAVLLQRSEGGALGIGGGGNVMSGRGAATALQKATWGLCAAFIATSMVLTWFAIEQARDRGLGLGEDPAGQERLLEERPAGEGGVLDLPDLTGRPIPAPAATGGGAEDGASDPAAGGGAQLEDLGGGLEEEPSLPDLPLIGQ